jgi:hypothetical protein
MKAYLQDDRGAQCVYWIKRSDVGIVGWFAAARMDNQHIGVPPDARVDIHFTYPADGDFHFSLKDQTSSQGNERFETVFSDRVRSKIIVGGERFISERPRTETDPDWHIMMPTYRLRPQKDYASEPICYYFATTGIPIANGRVASSALQRLPRIASLPPEKKPIVVGPLGSGTLNICACLLGYGASFAWDAAEIIWSIKDETRFPHIHLFAHFLAKPAASQDTTL